jgi:hypothetical protein
MYLTLIYCMKIYSLPLALFVSCELSLVLYYIISLLCILYYKSRFVNNQLDDSYKRELMTGA